MVMSEASGAVKETCSSPRSGYDPHSRNAAILGKAGQEWRLGFVPEVATQE